jgi:hypothetical protein
MHIGHSLFWGLMPVQWKVAETHAVQLPMNAWGSTFWLIVSYVMH